MRPNISSISATSGGSVLNPSQAIRTTGIPERACALISMTSDSNISLLLIRLSASLNIASRKDFVFASSSSVTEPEIGGNSASQSHLSSREGSEKRSVPFPLSFEAATVATRLSATLSERNRKRQLPFFRRSFGLLDFASVISISSIFTWQAVQP